MSISVGRRSWWGVGVGGVALLALGVSRSGLSSAWGGALPSLLPADALSLSSELALSVGQDTTTLRWSGSGASPQRPDGCEVLEVRPSAVQGTVCLKIFDSLSRLERTHSFAPDPGEAYGFSSPEMQLVFRGKEGELKRVTVGALQAVTKRRYVQISGEPDVVMVPEESLAKFKQSVQELKSHNPFESGGWERSGLELARFGSDFLTIKPSPAESWTVQTAHGAFPGDTNIINSIVQGLKRAPVLAFVPNASRDEVESGGARFLLRFRAAAPSSEGVPEWISVWSLSPGTSLHQRLSTKETAQRTLFLIEHPAFTQLLLTAGGPFRELSQDFNYFRSRRILSDSLLGDVVEVRYAQAETSGEPVQRKVNEALSDSLRNLVALSFTSATDEAITSAGVGNSLERITIVLRDGSLVTLSPGAVVEEGRNQGGQDFPDVPRWVLYESGRDKALFVIHRGIIDRLKADVQRAAS